MNSIVYAGQTYRAALCPKCHCKIWPPSTLSRHVEEHEAKALVFGHLLHPLQRKLNSMKLKIKGFDW